MVKVKGLEWQHVVVVKEPAKHGMATLVRCMHCEKVFQGNAMRIRAHLLGNGRRAGVLGCPLVPDEAREELWLIEIAKRQTQKKTKGPAKNGRGNNNKGGGATSAASDHSSGSAEHFDGDTKAVTRKAEQSFMRMGTIMAAVDLDTFFEGFGLRLETILKIKEMGFTCKTLMCNLDELPILLESINQHYQLTLGEEWGIKGAAKKWQKEQVIFIQPEDERWPDSENTSREVACIDSGEVTQLDALPKWTPQHEEQQLQQSNYVDPHILSSDLPVPNLSRPSLSASSQGGTDVGDGGSPGRSGYFSHLLSFHTQGTQGKSRYEEVDVQSQRQSEVKHSLDHGFAATF